MYRFDPTTRTMEAIKSNGLLTHMTSKDISVCVFVA